MGHYKKTCPLRGGVTSSSSCGVASTLPLRPPNTAFEVLAPNTGIATPSSTMIRTNLHEAVGSDHGDSNEDSNSDEDGEAAENSDVLADVEEENPGPEVVELMSLAGPAVLLGPLAGPPAPLSHLV